MKIYKWLLTKYCIIGLVLLASCGKDETESPGETEPEVIVDNDITPLTKKLMDNSTVIGTFVSDATTVISPGMTMTKISFKRQDNLLVTMNVLEADMKTPKLELQAMSPYNDYINGLQRLSEMSRDNELPGTNIMAAINGDTFTTAGALSSLFYVNNRVFINTVATNRTYFAALNDGTLVIGGKDTKGVERPVDKAQIKNAIGGVQWLVDNATKANLTDVTITARTAIGYTTDKIIYSIVVDGGQPEYSNGLSLVDLRDLMFSLGVKDAINLDGASSSTLVTKDLAKGQWIVQNRPLTVLNQERLIGNGLAFVVKN